MAQYRATKSCVPFRLVRTDEMLTKARLCIEEGLLISGQKLAAKLGIGVKFACFLQKKALGDMIEELNKDYHNQY